MSEKEGKLKIWDKLKKIKHIEVYIAIIFIVILLLIYLSTTSSSSSATTDTTELTITSYIDNLESELEEILSSISGVSNVKVMITLDMSSATITDSKITLDEMPIIKGVIITAKGVSDTATKLKVLLAVEAVLDISSGNIQIISSV